MNSNADVGLNCSNFLLGCWRARYADVSDTDSAVGDWQSLRHQERNVDSCWVSSLEAALVFDDNGH